MNDSPKRSKPTLDTLLRDQHVITGKKLIERERTAKQEAERAKAVLEEAIEFERRNRRSK